MEFRNVWFRKAFRISIFASSVIFVFELPFVCALELHLFYKWSTRIISGITLLSHRILTVIGTLLS